MAHRIRSTSPGSTSSTAVPGTGVVSWQAINDTAIGPPATHIAASIDSVGVQPVAPVGVAPTLDEVDVTLVGQPVGVSSSMDEADIFTALNVVISATVDNFAINPANSVATTIDAQLALGPAAVSATIAPTVDTFTVDPTNSLSTAATVDRFDVGMTANSVGVAIANSMTAKFISNGSYSLTTPPTVTSLTAECWGAGGGGGSASLTVPIGGGGAGGGGYSKSALSVSASTSYNLQVGKGGLAAGFAGSGNPGAGGTDSWFNTSGIILAKGGAGGGGPSATTQGAGGAGGAAASGIGTTKTSGGTGGGGGTGTLNGGGGGGSGGDTTGGGAGNTNGTAGTAGTTNGAAGGSGTATTTIGTTPGSPGGGGGGSSSIAAAVTGADGAVWLTFSI